MRARKRSSQSGQPILSVARKRAKASASAAPASGSEPLDNPFGPKVSGTDLIVMARPKRFELLTPRFVVWCSIQLSYGRGLRCAG
jgi:hypothetical protein